MCGRYAVSTGNIDLAELFGAQDETGVEFVPDFNVAPTAAAPFVRMAGEGRRVLDLGRWGLLPPWAADARGAARMINARAETVATSRAYADPFRRRRCLVPVDGWYEWRRLTAGGSAGRNARKQAYFMTSPDGDPLALAGIWSVWHRGSQRRLTYSVVTTSAVGECARIHDRMPLVMPSHRWEAWLGRGVAGMDHGAQMAALLEPPSPQWLDRLEIRPVGPAVGDVRNHGPLLVERVSAPAVDDSTTDGLDFPSF